MKTLLSWPVTVASGTTVQVVANGVPEVLTLAAGTYAGISYSGTGMGVGADSLAQAVCDMLVTHNHISACTAVYDFSPASGTGHPATIYTVSKTDHVADELDFVTGGVTLDRNTVGFLSDYPPMLTNTLITEVNSAGYWCPIRGADNCLEVRDLVIVGSQSNAASATADAGYSTRKLGEPYHGRLLYDVVDTAYIRLSDAEDTVSALPDIAHRTVGDAQNILERVLVAAADNNPIQVYRDQEHRFQCRISQPWTISAITSSMGNSGVRYTVTIPHRVTT